jgi:hypothetical protein
VRREIALNGSFEAGPFQSTVIGRVFQQTVWAFPEHPFISGIAWVARAWHLAHRD